MDPFVVLLFTIMVVLSTGVAIGADARPWVIWVLMMLSAMSVGVTVHAVIDFSHSVQTL
jgi:hypothetical protein